MSEWVAVLAVRGGGGSCSCLGSKVAGILSRCEWAECVDGFLLATTEAAAAATEAGAVQLTD